ncbi:phosphorothioated DNA-binding restriction endonuclease [Streptantibioticus parmotrematis]|uniref:phosphorothioated DNA-binding restriction endonuclease n=1 Tax=Streptantibioticus parmotrematis TaxID=2873249 RepID=UPI0033C00F7B
MTRDEFMAALTTLRRAQVNGRRAPHKPLLLLWLLGRFCATGSSAVSYAEAEEPVSTLINEFGPVVTDPVRARQRAAMPFVHLERSLWELSDRHGEPIGSDEPERGGRLRDRGAHGRLRPPVERLLADSATLAAAVRLLLDQHFTPALEGPVCDAAGLDPAASRTARRRRAAFTEEVLRAYAYACAFCGYDGALGRHPVGLEAAHVRWFSQDGPDEVDNGLALCALHHTLLDFGVLGLAPNPLRVQVSELYVARGDAGRAVDDLHGRPVRPPRPGRPAIAPAHVLWHGRQVFRRPGAAA